MSWQLFPRCQARCSRPPLPAEGAGKGPDTPPASHRAASAWRKGRLLDGPESPLPATGLWGRGAGIQTLPLPSEISTNLVCERTEANPGPALHVTWDPLRPPWRPVLSSRPLEGVERERGAPGTMRLLPGSRISPRPGWGPRFREDQGSSSSFPRMAAHSAGGCG